MTHTDKHDTCPAPIMFTSTKEKDMKALTIICNIILIAVSTVALCTSVVAGIPLLASFSFACLVALGYALNGLLMS